MKLLRLACVAVLAVALGGCVFSIGGGGGRPDLEDRIEDLENRVDRLEAETAEEV